MFFKFSKSEKFSKFSKSENFWEAHELSLTLTEEEMQCTVTTAATDPQ